MLELLALPFFQRALLVGVVLGVLMAVLGVFVVLRRMSFFADAIGHSALTGIALGILLQFNPFIAALGFTMAVAAGIAWIRRRSQLHLDTLLGVFFPAAMALGVIVVQLTPGFRTDLVSFLFGDILTVGQLDVWLAIGLAVIVSVCLFFIYKPLLKLTLDESLAKTEGVATGRYELLFLLLLAATIALAIKLVGIILVTALIVVPAASAQHVARSMTSLVVGSVGFGLAAVILGMLASAAINIPSGPAIVLVLALLFVGAFTLRHTRSS